MVSCKKEKCKCAFDDWSGKIRSVDITTYERKLVNNPPPGTSASYTKTWVENGKLISFNNFSQTTHDTTNFVPQELEIEILKGDSVQIGEKRYALSEDKKTAGYENLYFGLYLDYWEILGNQLIHYYETPYHRGGVGYSSTTIYSRKWLIH